MKREHQYANGNSIIQASLTQLVVSTAQTVREKLWCSALEISHFDVKKVSIFFTYLSLDFLCFWDISNRMGEYHKSFLATPNILVYTLIKPKST